ncbi:PH domain-containing protein [Luethyella okanaganae]|uniref:PH domain-containing protein n=1 Tax=Luethyella okanaganae TaxID=69372 RepID=A0ABW1VJP5_9MICO
MSEIRTDGRLEIPAGEWKRVSPKYLVVEIVGTLVAAALFCGGAAAVWLLSRELWSLWVLIGLVAIFLVTLLLEPRRVRSIGYQLREDDLLFRRGIMFQRFVAVPYGRMQLVDITRGPVARLLGLANLKFVTAAALTAVSIPGLPEAEAESLRDRLVALAESRRAGL